MSCRPPGRGGGGFFLWFSFFFGGGGGGSLFEFSYSDCMWDFSSLNFGILNASDLAFVN